MKHLFRSHMLRPFASRSRAAWMAFAVVTALALLLIPTATPASAASKSGAILKLTTASDTNHIACPADNICLYSGLNYSGEAQLTSFPVPASNTYVPVLIPTVRSYINNGDTRGWLNQFRTGNHGISFCMSPNSRNPNITGPWDNDPWLLLSANSSGC